MADDAVVLIAGGAGYIGSHAARALLEAGSRVVVVDDLSTGHRRLVPPGVPLIEGSAGDRELVGRVIAGFGVTAVMHFAGSIVAPASVSQPLAYYGNNTVNSHALIDAAIAGGVRRFIFSSTAAVYGNAGGAPITEAEPPAPINPYGTSKLMTEWMLRDAAAAHDFRYVALRYFNVAGADPGGRSGQAAAEATHLIRLACQTALGRRSELSIFGTDYPTPDGTCVRDYIHVSDLADAHVLACRHLHDGGGTRVLNCGYGHGASVREVIATVERVTGRPLPVREAPRRPGDPASLVADSAALRRLFDWRPRFDDLPTIVRHALAWEERLPALLA